MNIDELIIDDIESVLPSFDDKYKCGWCGQKTDNFGEPFEMNYPDEDWVDATLLHGYCCLNEKKQEEKDYIDYMDEEFFSSRL